MSVILLALSLLLSSPFIRPPLANHIDAPLPECGASDHVVGIYGNILYPQDKELTEQKKLLSWIEAYSEDREAHFPLSPEEMNHISLYILNRLASGALSNYFVLQVETHIADGKPLEDAIAEAKLETLIRGNLYKEIAENVPAWAGRCEILSKRLVECADQVQQIVDRETKAIKNAPGQKKAIEVIEPPFTWDMRVFVLKQMVDKVISVSPNSPYFLALQEVTPQALDDLKQTFANRNLQWISFNHISGKETLVPGKEDVFGEATGFTSTIALSRDFEVLKVELGDLPTESGSIRKILGVRVRNTRTDEPLNIFTTHTDHKIQNDIYARTATKIHTFATQFFQDALHNQRFILGGDLNAFEKVGGDKYIEKLLELFVGSRDFRETNYYAPHPIAWSTFIGRGNDAFSGRIAKDGRVEPNAFDHILVGNGIKLLSAEREALVYNKSGRLLDYYKEPEEYIESLKERVTFSDHFFNIVRFK